ncbi:MAG: hypothetical protein ABIY40_07825 [Rhodanobacteraceae bacterium]|nr:hypothetical protein [Pseudomonadota bacterium]
MRKGISRLCLTIGLALATAAFAHAADFDLTAGASATAGVRWTPALFFSAAGTPADDGHAHFAPIASAGFIGSRSTDVHDLDRNVFLAGGGVRYGSTQGLFVSEQIVATSTRTDALSSRFEFMTSVSWQRSRYVLLARHISNAHLLGNGKNLGETMLLAGVQF